MSETRDYSVEFITSLSQVDASAWDSVTGSDYPFLRHAFLYGMETSGCTSAHTGWQPCHALLRNGKTLSAVLPLYLKTHSYGEYVFDWAWADAWQRMGLEYYPKLLSAIPFTPATGPRLSCIEGLSKEAAWPMLIEAITGLAQERGLSSWHLLFPDRETAAHLSDLGLPRRLSTQFHWLNQGYSSFDDFLASFSSRKRKSLRRERARVIEQGLTLRRLQGSEISPEQWQKFHRFYQLTYAKRSGHGGYLSSEFFTKVAPALGEQVLMVLAEQGQEAVAGALYFRSGDTLYGRYWGCEQEFDCLHFEACYYQGIEYCIENGLSRFDPGAQGEHKIQRGFTPVLTYSSHWVAEPELAAAVADFTRREAVQVQQYREQAAELLPFKREG